MDLMDMIFTYSYTGLNPEKFITDANNLFFI